MKRWLCVALLLAGAGCVANVPSEDVPDTDTPQAEPTALLPVDRYVENRDLKLFGMYISDRFEGYHVGDDIEFDTEAAEVPIVAIMDGAVVRIDDVAGYGGMALVDHGDVNAIYGHIDLSSTTLEAGDTVMKGQFIANLGEEFSDETDGERGHLHFALYEGEPTRINGYEQSAVRVGDWINPQDFFTAHGIDMSDGPHPRDTAPDVLHLSFWIPENMGFEYVPSIDAINLFSLHGDGTARERSQIFIRYFDASEFLTLSTVHVYSTEVLTVGEGYDARRYDIEKKGGIADFASQPSWRNERHIVTDFTDTEGYGRYYVVAANPALDPAIYEQFLRDIEIY